jgi:16S rRNA (guanine966-N2)-methyltransferase
MVLDLFAGSGNLGIEALSMGAKECHFVDKNKEAIQTITENLDKLGITASTTRRDFKEFIKSTDKKFDIIFLDPPYNTGLLPPAVKLIESHNLLNDGGIVVIEGLLVEYNTDLTLLKSKKYGDKFVSVYKK